MFYDVENHADKHAYETSQVNLNLHDTEATGYKKKKSYESSNNSFKFNPADSSTIVLTMK